MSNRMVENNEEQNSLCETCSVISAANSAHIDCETESPYVFISYSSFNYVLALEIKNVLALNGIPCWMAPESISPGSDYAEKIPEAISHCAAFVLALSKEAQESKWVPKELDCAINSGKKVIPFHMDTSALAEAFNFRLSNVQRIVAFGRYSEAYEELIRTLRKEMGVGCNLEDNAAITAASQHYTINVGAVIEGKYRIKSYLDRGLFSTVFLAENISTGKLWVIKVVSKETDYFAEYIKGFSRQLNIMKRLDHPCLPKIIDIFQDDKSLLVVMDYVEGMSLRKNLTENGQINEIKIIEWAKQLCELLVYQHSQKPPVVLNDVNIRNVVLKPNGRLVLIDYGSFSHYTAGDKVDTSTIGTYVFKAPEFYQGEIDCRSDIYELGASLYVLITGVSPINMCEHKHPVRQLKPDISPDLEHIIEKCLQDNPDDRYQTAEDMLEDLNTAEIAQRTRKLESSRKNNKKSIFKKLFCRWGWT